MSWPQVWRIELSAGYYDETNVGVADMLFGSAYFWLSCLAVVALTAGSRLDAGLHACMHAHACAHSHSRGMHACICM